ncbi:MAG: dienelactone hydrolase family protein [Rubrivivax sp.]|nr:dienelactone hydrolase family protein [Rubrivivax sp.]
MATSWISVPASGGAFDAYLALPPAGRGPGLLLFQEIFGVNDHIRGVAEQYALDGFVVLVPDVFWRQQPRVELGYEGEQRQQAAQLASQLKPEDVMTDLSAGVAALRARPEVAGAKVGAIGYCMGGRLAYSAAALTEIDAAVAYYGGGIHDQLHLASGINCPVQFHYAENDDHIGPAAVERVRAAMAGKAAEVHVYAGAKHGFNCWARASYHAPSAALAHGRSLAFLAAALFEEAPHEHA